MQEVLHFKVSSGLKNIIGRELINNKFIAIFELVKNSYDAGAHNVEIRFDDLGTNAATIKISDDGHGMNKDDIINKWLFVAYSEKRTPSYRDKIKRAVAGAKGVGRFSCDRLGERVTLVSKIPGEHVRHRISIKWSDFEKDYTDSFTDINVLYEAEQAYPQNSGTDIIISDLREEWNRADLLALKKALAQMVNPAATEQYDPFEVKLLVPNEIDNDKEEKEERNKVNGVIVNRVFQILNEKTIKIKASIPEDGKTITTELIDRGVHLFKTVEKNEFSIHNITCELFFLNRSAKINFARIMGVDSVNYGSIFVYKNGFRIYPYGEPGEDFFDIDKRKQQGYKRFLGTRELIGQIAIFGNQSGFTETSSRNNGFIDSPQLAELKQFFLEYAFKPLEKYVVQIVQWGDTESFEESVKDIDTFNDVPQIVRKIKSRTKKDAYISIEYNQDLTQIIAQYKPALTKAVKDLREYAFASSDNELLKRADSIEKQTKTLEKRAFEAQREAQAHQEALEKVNTELLVTKKQAGILAARANLTAKEAVDALHIIRGYADTIDSNIAEIYEVADEAHINIVPLLMYLSNISQTCEKIMSSYNLVLRTNYSAGTDIAYGDIAKFIESYLSSATQPISIEVKDACRQTPSVKFNPLEFSIVLDNIVSNAQKANATMLWIMIEDCKSGILVRCRDNGYGLNPSADPARLFEVGYTTTTGTGIGMNTIKKYVEKAGGRVAYNPEYKDGFEILLYL